MSRKMWKKMGGSLSKWVYQRAHLKLAWLKSVKEEQREKEQQKIEEIYFACIDPEEWRDQYYCL